ncbi:rhophilin-2 [Aplysia californica]|uniref:Rhophilin-2 n=1 Tax=Aplysia californica TaxID=6500 RepID=A0ABM1A6C8_APLCA|nr:rhophilin-2 [Aplysia californica]
MSQTIILDTNMNQENVFRKGCDPLSQTARGKLQNQRQKLNEKINKELRMRTGAENLYRAAENNKKLRERVSLELSYFNSNIQLLKEQLAEMNSSVTVYQHENSTSITPMIPLGLKETTAIDFTTAFKDEILEHYSEDGEKYLGEMKELQDLREAVRTPSRNQAGVELLMEYFNQLSYVERRFFSSRRQLAVFFHWYDCLTGVPNTQRSIGFEKGSVLYNMGALYTQIACKQDRTTKEGVVQSIVNFEKAAGIFQYLATHFSHAPSQDMQQESLAMLVSLMLAQAQECVLESRLICGSKDGIFACTQIAQEASMVSQRYKDTHEKMSLEPTKSYLPFSWLAMAETKQHFFRGLSHYYIALALLEQKDSREGKKLKMMFEAIHAESESTENGVQQVPVTDDEQKNLGKGHLREAVVNHEESIRIHNLCKQLRKIDSFRDILQKTHERAVNKFSSLEEEDDFSELILVPEIAPRSEHKALFVLPDFSKVKVIDIFRKLGPISVFNASSDWSAPRVVVLERQPTEGFGFSVKGDSPVVVADMEAGSVAARSGMKVKDYIVGVGIVDTKWAKHEAVVQLVKQASLSLKLMLVTPMPKPEPSATRPFSTISLPTSPLKQVQITSQAAATERERKSHSRLSAPWMFVRRNSSKDRTSERPKSTAVPVNGNIKLVSNGNLRGTSHFTNGGDVEL